MFATTAVVAFIAASAVSAASVMPRAKYAVPTTYTAKWLEPYDDYHTRYLGLQCDKKHNTKLFDECCHPMLKWEKIESARPKYCVPGAFTPASVISTTVKATATIKPITRVAIVSTSTAAPAASTTPVVDDDEEDCDEEDEEDDDEEDCDEEEDDEDECVEGEEDCVCEEVEVPVTSVKPTSTKVSSTTQAASTSSKSVVFITSTVTAATSSKAATTVIPSSTFTFSSSSRMTTVRVTSTQAASSSSKQEVESSSKAPETPKTTATLTTSSKASPTVAADLTKVTSGSYSGGFATYYYQGGNAGACGEKKQDGDLIAAIDFRRYGKTNAKSLLCGARLTVTNTKNGKSVNVIVKDACPTCENENSVDLSEAAFLAIATRDEGMVPIKVSFAGRE